MILNYLYNFVWKWEHAIINEKFINNNIIKIKINK